MAFSDIFADLMDRPSPLMRNFSQLISERSGPALEEMARQSREITRRNFGRTMRMFAPLYISNECVNNCKYCGFSRDAAILRTTLSVDQVVREARHLHSEGFRSLILLGGEHPKFVSEGLLQQCLNALRSFIPTLALEVGPMGDGQYKEIVEHGAEGLVVYQETYHRETYESLHTAGPKRRFDWRLDCPERAYAGGFRRIGIGALFGLASWEYEAMALAAHLEYLTKVCWRANFTVGFPRMQPYAGNYQYEPDPFLYLTDRAFVRLMAAIRITFPHVGIVLSTRERPIFRDSIAALGVTHMSAGSRTEPGGYTGAGFEDLHLTTKGRRVELKEKTGCERATEQFQVSDTRTPAEVAAALIAQDIQPIWKDWDDTILRAASPLAGSIVNGQLSEGQDSG